MALQWEPLTEDSSEEAKILIRHFSLKHRPGYVRSTPGNIIMPKFYLEFKDAIDNFEVREDDIWINTYPKSGTTWAQEMVWCIAHDLDFVGAQEPILTRSPFFDLTPRFDSREKLKLHPETVLPLWATDSVRFVDELKSPRIIKTHLPLQILPKQLLVKNPKIIYVHRNPKDTCVSHFHFVKSRNNFTGNFQDYTKLFLGDSLTSMPFWSHVLPFWERRQQSNILFLRYEEMKKDLPAVILKTADFLGKSLTQSQVHILADHLNFDNMKKNESVNRKELNIPKHIFSIPETGASHMRKGEVNQWKADMTPELIEEFDKWIETHTKNTGLKY